MATRNIVPRATGEGSIGTTVKRWFTGFFDNLTLGRVTVNNNELAPIDDNSVSLGAALKRWATGFFKNIHVDGPVICTHLAAEGNHPINVNSNVGHIYMYGPASGQWYHGIYLRNNSGEEVCQIACRGADDNLDYLWIGNSVNDSGFRYYPGDRTELRYAGNRKLYTDPNGVHVCDDGDGDGLKIRVYNSDNVNLGVQGNSNSFSISGFNSSSEEVSMMLLDPDSGGRLYHAGSESLRAEVNGITIFNENGEEAIFAWNGAHWTVRSRIPGASIYLTGHNASAVPTNIVGGSPDGEAYLYYNSDVKLTTKVTGVYVDGTVQASGSDIAEKYTCAEEKIIPGTVMKACDSGDYEVEECDTELCANVVGVCSVDPGYILNSESEGVVVGLTGKVPVRIIGPVGKGKPIVPAGNGAARQIREDSELLYKIGQSVEENLEQEEKLVMCIIK